MLNTALLRPWNVLVISSVTVVAMFLFAQAKSCLDNGRSDNQ